MTPGYTAVSLIGKGAGSTIHKVRHDRSGTIYALKRVQQQDDPEGRFFCQIRDEYEVGRRVAHPNVRQLHELFRTRKLLRVVELALLMEYLEGETLDRAGLSDLNTLVKVFAAVGGALQAINHAGFVHADIKPNNIMICNNQEVKIFDLGQSCKLGTVKQRIQGTPDFIAPEQVMKLPVDERTDVFNLGATMYWCLTGKAFPTRIKSRQRAGSFDIASVRHAGTPQESYPQVPAVLSNLVMDCCRNSPASRPGMTEVLERIKSVERVVHKIRK